MSLTDLKLYGVNTLAMAISFTNIENTLKIVLLLASIVYTLLKTIQLMKDKGNDDKGDNI